MRAVVLPDVKQPLQVIDDHPEPAAMAGRGGGEIIEVTACGLCHSDLHVVDGDYPSPLPLVLGHEVTGIHPDMGPVMVYAPWGCGSCRECDAGLQNICANSTEAGLFTDGGYAERMWVPGPSYLAPLDGLDPVATAPLACGGLTAYRAVSHTLDHLRSRNDARVMVIGVGGLGQFALRCLRLQTDAQVIAVDVAADKRERALALGAHEAVGPGDEMGPVDVAIDFHGSEATLTTAAGSVYKQGMIVCVGLAGGGLPFGFGSVPHEAHLLTSVWGSRAQLDELLDLARREPSIVQPVETMPLVEAQAAHDRLRAGQVEGRIVLVP